MDGKFLDGWSLAERPVVVTLSETELCIAEEHGLPLRHWSLSGLQVDAMQEGLACHVSHESAPHEELVLHNEALAKRLLAVSQHVAVLPGGEHKLLFGLGCLLLFAAVMAGVYAGLPRLARAIAVHIPLEHERALGAQLEVMLSFGECDNDEAESVLNRLADQLGEARDARPGIRIVRESMPNAFALPGGLVVVTTGLLQKARSAEELAGVLAHELEHIAQRHVLAGALRDALLTALWSITLGDYSGLMVVDPSTAYRIANLQFTRDDEQAADRGAVARLHRAGFSHRGLVQFFESMRVTGESDGSEQADERSMFGFREQQLSMLSTHPSTGARIRELTAQRDLEAARAPLSEAQLETLRHACPGP